MIKQIHNVLDESILEQLRTFPNQGILFEIIEKKQTGKIFALSGNAILIMENCSDPFVFIVGRLTDESVNDIIALVSALEFPMVYCQPKYHPLFLKHGWELHLRATLSLKNTNKVQEDSLGQYMKIQPIKLRDIFKKCSWYKERSELYGSDENFLAHGLGYALCIESEVISEAYASIGLGCAEIGVITHPDYRTKGYAKLIVSHLIKECKKAHIIPKWSCNVDNKASLATGLKIGFEIDGYYTFLVPHCSNVLCKND